MAKISRLLRPSIKAISPPPFLCTSNSHTSTKRKYTHSLPPTLSDTLVARFRHTRIVPSRLLGSKMKATSQKRYALLLAARDSDYVKEVYGGYFNVFVAAFAEDGEKWDLYRVVDGEFPDMDELHRYDGFVISGSPHDAYGKDCWILKLCLLLQTLDAMDKKILGICFGHQVLCRALGGKVGKAHTGWDIGLTKVRIVKDLSPCGYLNKMDDIPPALSIIECHQDEVWELPAGAEVIAFSDKTGVEMFAVGDHILGIQGHPEYTKDILFNLIDRLLNNGCIEKGFAENAKFALEIAEPDRKCWERICRNFLKGR